MFPEDKSKETIFPISERCIICNQINEGHSKESLEKCSLVLTIKIHALEYKMKLRKFSE